MMSDDQILEVVQAHKEGRPIEVLLVGEHVWEKCAVPFWNFGEAYYRVAPEPRKPRVINLVYKGAGTWKEECSCNIGLAEKPIRFSEVIE